MMRRVAPRAATIAAPSAMTVTSRRNLTECPILCNIAYHTAELATVATYTSGATLAFTPIGTAALVAAAFATSSAGIKYNWFLTELAIRDYIQDNVLQVVLRYLTMISLMLAFVSVFIES